MALRIFTNIASLNSQRTLGNNNSMLGQSIERIASGIRIRSAADDASGLSMSETITSDIQALRQGSKNMNDSVALIKTSEGALGEISTMLIRLRELASQAATGTIGDTERGSVQLEFTALSREIDRISSTTEFNGQKLIDGSMASTALNHVVIQTGSKTTSNDRIDLNNEVNLTSVTTTSLGISGSSITTQSKALSAMDSLAQAIQSLVQIRGRLGAALNRIARSIGTQDATVENLTSAVSSIKEADMAEEMAGLTRNQILVQSASAMVGQANLIPQSVLRLLQQ
ncbi:MAG: flagellin FliC [Nitrospinae bacterium]|nr:flagellin FliC [Nitrospinota bacterium]